MRLTKACEYAVRCVLYLSAREKGIIVSSREIAMEMDIPYQFLGRIARQLFRSGMIEIVQGSKGGFRLSVSPEQLSLLHVIEAVTGPIFFIDCISRPESCGKSNTCMVHSVWHEAESQFRETLGKATFAKLLK